MIEFFIGLGIYALIGFVLSFFFTSTAYESLLEKNPAEWNVESIGEARALELEQTRRKYHAKNAKTYGFWFSVFWCIVIPIELILQVIRGFSNVVNAISIAKHDRDFIKAQSDLKTKQILDTFEKQQKEQFDKALNDGR